MDNNIELKPFYLASVSGGKDSLFMFYMLINDWKYKYKLDGVIYFELENDYPFIKDVIKLIAKECKKLNLFFMNIKPRIKWLELYNKYGYPSRRVRWCNSKYKLDGQRQLEEYLKKFALKPIMYIGFCADEQKRFKYKLNDANAKNIYPLAEQGINESLILEWAKKQKIYNDYYKYNKRCGCFMCPMASMKNLAYNYNYYYNDFIKYLDYAESNNKMKEPIFRYNKEKLIKVIKRKYLEDVKHKQQTIFDLMEDL